MDHVIKGNVGGVGDVLLRDGDKLLVPKKTQEITILGEVQAPTSHVFQAGLTRDEYIAKSGGTTRKADRKRIYVVRANGDVVSGERSGLVPAHPVSRNSTGRYDRGAARHREGQRVAAVSGCHHHYLQSGSGAACGAKCLEMSTAGWRCKIIKRRFNYLKLLALMFLAVFVVSCGEDGDYVPPPAAKSAPNTVAFMGDSITSGWDLTQYQGLLSLNFGRPGDNTSQMLARFHNQVIDSDPAVVVILGGINDFQERGQSGTNTDSIKAMAAAASAAGIRVILCSVLPTDYPNSNLNLPEIVAFNEQLVQLAQENGYRYADYYDVMLNSGGLTDDSLFDGGLHPNEAGYARMWAVISPLIEDALGAQN